MSNSAPYVRPSRVTIPRKAHPLAKLVFELMRRHGKTYDQLEFEAGVLRSTFKAWRGGGALRPNVPSLASVEAALGSFGWRLVPCPPLDSLPSETQAALEEISLDFLTDDEALAAAVLVATTKADARAKNGKPAPRLEYRHPYWLDAA
ncbi:hypothetical protein U8326_06465 [Tsuneonella sp. CC-YZS046]|uniref:hypothetical protein n=1 Tax=Tsuneonella sp. CC-YZS046 TaxID=3042152 RepID=UPI002D78BF32|nr:hypothetical protein [Tsuneonella sp. CC-YZS046]WRO67794.1 hypothetical protein U8326_06465 [Tsuneonella sp. CC-YZS046]